MRSSQLPPEMLLLVFQHCGEPPRNIPQASSWPLTLDLDRTRSTQNDLAALCLVSRRFLSLAAPLLYRRPTISTLKRLRSLKAVLERSALATLTPDGNTLLPYFSYMQGINLSTMDEVSRCHPEVAKLTYEAIAFAVCRSLDYAMALLPDTAVNYLLPHQSLSMAPVVRHTSQSLTTHSAWLLSSSNVPASSNQMLNVTMPHLFSVSAGVRRCTSSLSCDRGILLPSVCHSQKYPLSSKLITSSASSSPSPFSTTTMITVSDNSSTSPNTIQNSLSVESDQKSSQLLSILPWLGKSHINTLPAIHPLHLPMTRLPVPRLTHLNLCFVKHIDLTHMAHSLKPYLAYLTHLNLSGTSKYDAQYIAIINQSPNLVRLSLSWNNALTDLTLIAVAANCPLLTHLDIANCREVTDVGVVRVIKCCSRMQGFAMNWCLHVANETMWYALRKWPRLRVLSVIGARPKKETLHEWWTTLAEQEWTEETTQLQSLNSENFKSNFRDIAKSVKRIPEILINLPDPVFYIDL